MTQGNAVSQFRRDLTLQLALQRALLFRQMIGLSDDALEKPLWDDYSIRRVLPHIALWDGFEAERLALLRDGRLDDITWTPVDERNAQWHAAYADTTVDAGVAMLQKERQGLLNVLDSVSDELLKATVSLSEDFQLPVLNCISSSVAHDETHAAEIAAWRSKENGLERWQNGSQSILLAALKAGRRALKALVFTVVSAETSKKGPVIVGDWTIKETLGHLLGWEKNYHETMALGQTTLGGTDLHETNAGFVRDSAEMSIEDLWATFEATRRESEALLASLPIEKLHGPFQTRSKDIYSPYLWTCMLVGHDTDHLEEIYGAYLKYTRLK